MAEETKVVAQAAAEAPAKVAEAVAETVEKIADESAKVAKRTRASTARRAKRELVAAKAAPRRAKTIRRKTRTSARKPVTKTARPAQKRNQTVTNNAFFNGFDAVPAFAPFQTLFADAIRTLAEAKSPTEYLQLQGEFARASFDRMVAEGSKMTETMVKLAGQAFQPIQNRAAANAERFNTLVA